MDRYSILYGLLSYKEVNVVLYVYDGIIFNREIE